MVKCTKENNSKSHIRYFVKKKKIAKLSLKDPIKNITQRQSGRLPCRPWWLLGV